MQTTTSFPGPFAPIPKLWRRLWATSLVSSLARDLVIAFETSAASQWITVSSFEPHSGDSARVRVGWSHVRQRLDLPNRKVRRSRLGTL
jgi:hypothetical protein